MRGRKLFVWFGRAFKRAGTKKEHKKWATNIHRRISIHIDCTYMSHPGTGNRMMERKAEKIVGSKHSNRQSKTGEGNKKGSVTRAITRGQDE
jgi:hypothetical protein